MNAETQDSDAPDPVRRRDSPVPSLSEVLAGLDPLDEDFPEINDPPTQPEDMF